MNKKLKDAMRKVMLGKDKSMSDEEMKLVEDEMNRVHDLVLETEKLTGREL